MKNLKLSVSIASVLILLICIYSFLLGNEVFKGKFSNESIPWYFLAKGLFLRYSAVSSGQHIRSPEKQKT